MSDLSHSMRIDLIWSSWSISKRFISFESLLLLLLIKQLDNNCILNDSRSSLTFVVVFVTWTDAARICMLNNNWMNVLTCWSVSSNDKRSFKNNQFISVIFGELIFVLLKSFSCSSQLRFKLVVLFVLDDDFLIRLRGVSPPFKWISLSAVFFSMRSCLFGF